MTDNITKWTAAGLDGVHVAYRGAGGYMAGFANLDATDTNTGSGMRRLKGAQTFPISVPTPASKAILGDDGRLDTFFFENSDVNEGVLEVGEFDNPFAIAAEGINALTVGPYTFYGRGGSIANPATLMFLLTRQAHARDSGAVGEAGFENEIVMLTRVKPLQDEAKQHQTEGKARYNVTFDDSEVTPWGSSIATDFGVLKRQSIVFRSPYRAALHCWVGDGTASETTALDYTPISGATNVKAWNAVTGAALTVSSVNTSTKKVTLSAAPASGVIVVLLYQTAVFG